MSRLCLVTAIGLSGCGGGGGGSTLSGTYRIVDLGPGDQVFGIPISDTGLAIYNSTDPTNPGTLINVATKKRTVLGPRLLHGRVTNSNLVVGDSGGNVLTLQGPGFKQAKLQGSGDIFQIAVGPKGEVSGFVDAAVTEAAFWSSVTASPVAMKPVSGATGSMQPKGMNASHAIVGRADSLACYYSSPTAVGVGLPGGGSGEADAINDSGEIVGTTTSIVFALWKTPSSVPTAVDLGPFTGKSNLQPFGINNAGVVVGGSNLFGGVPTVNLAFVYAPSTGLKSLHDLCDSSVTGWVLDKALSVNNHGWIYGTGALNGVNDVFVAIPN